jgi:hypothetical protein
LESLTRPRVDRPDELLHRYTILYDDRPDELLHRYTILYDVVEVSSRFADSKRTIVIALRIERNGCIQNDV